MASLLLKAAAILIVGTVAGAAHSWVRSAGDRPIRFQLEAPAPLTIQLPDKPVPPVAPSDTTPSHPSPTPANPVPAPVQPTPPVAAVDSINLTIEQAKALYDQQVPFIDARHFEDYTAGHVQNAFLLSTEDFNGSDVLNYLDRTQPLVVYCSGGACDASKNLVILLQQAGYKGSRIMEDGFPGWQKAGYPTATGKPLIGGVK